MGTPGNEDVHFARLEEAVLIDLDESQDERHALPLEPAHNGFRDEVVAIRGVQNEKWSWNQIRQEVFMLDECTGDTDIDQEAIPIDCADVVIDQDGRRIARLDALLQMSLVLSR